MFSLPFGQTDLFIDLICDLLPLFMAAFSYKLSQDDVFTVGPGDLLRLLFVFRLPFVVTLVVISAGDELGYVGPIIHSL